MLESYIWVGWQAGIAIGFFVVLHFWLTGRSLGCSSAYGHACGRLTGHSYFKLGTYSRSNDWRLWFLLGTPLGGLLAVMTTPADWQATLSLGAFYDSVLPQSTWAKGLILTLGGFLIGLGARMADGCTSGHTISGISLLAPASLLASALFFVGGLVTVQFMARLGGLY